MIVVLNLVEPWVILDLSQCDPLLWVRGQHAFDKITARLTDKTRHFVLPSDDLLIKPGSVGILKRQEPTHHGIEDDARGPYVNTSAVIPFALDHLGCSIAWAATGCLEHVLILPYV